MGIHLNGVIDFSIKNELSFIDTLIKLTNYEIDVREHNMIHTMVKVAAFPHLKEIMDINFAFSQALANNKYSIFKAFVSSKKMRILYSLVQVVSVRPPGHSNRHYGS